MTGSLPADPPPADAAIGPGSAMGPGFVLLLDVPSSASVAESYGRLCDDVSDDCESITRLSCPVRWSWLPPVSHRLEVGGALERASRHLGETIAQLTEAGAGPIFVVPGSFDFGSESQQWLTEQVREQARRAPRAQLHYDAPNVAHPLLVQAFVDRACEALASLPAGSPGSLGVLLVAAGAGDVHTRADSYKLMRLLWEQLGAARGEVAFLRHPKHPLPEQLAACEQSGLRWVAVAQELWAGERYEHAELIFGNHAGGEGAGRLALTRPTFEHPNVRGYFVQRCLALHRSKSERLRARSPSPKYAQTPEGRVFGPAISAPLAEWDRSRPDLRFGRGVVVEVSSAADLARALSALGAPSGRAIVKPTWHGYATGTYTDPLALASLLEAVGPGAVVVEGHATGRHTGEANFDWETQAEQNRTWIAEQEQQYLERTGLLQAMRGGGASYLNVTEAHWNGQCAARGEVAAALEAQGVRLQFEELLGFVPQALFNRRGAPMISYARFKGPTRLSLSNLFGLIPAPFRSAWHGPNIEHFASVCCDLAKLYSALFSLYGVVESLVVAVRWDRQGLYRCRWGNYDLLPRPGVVCLSPGVSTADVLAARLQGQDVRRSAFFRVVEGELGIDPEAAEAPLPSELLRRFA